MQILFPFMILAVIVGFIPTAILGFLGLLKFGDGTGNESGIAEFMAKSAWVGFAIIVLFFVIGVTVLICGVKT